MLMYYVTDPNETIRLIQSLISNQAEHHTESQQTFPESIEHTHDTQEKVKEVLH